MIWHNEKNGVRHDNMPDDGITDLTGRCVKERCCTNVMACNY